MFRKRCKFQLVMQLSDTKVVTKPLEWESGWFWANIYKVSASIFALEKLGVLERLTQKELELEQIAFEHKLNIKILKTMLRLLVSVGILTCNRSKYKASKKFSKLLPLIRLEERTFQKITKNDALLNVSRNNVIEVNKDTLSSDFLKVYYDAMAVNAHSIAPYIAKLLSRSKAKMFVDLGGGDGSLALKLIGILPYMKGIVVDLPYVKPFFLQNQQEKISLVTADLQDIERWIYLIQDASAVIISNVLHLLESSFREVMLRSILQALKPERKLIVYDQFQPTDGTINTPGFMQIDWALMGLEFEISVDNFSDSMTKIGFQNVSVIESDLFPGAIIIMETPKKINL